MTEDNKDKDLIRPYVVDGIEEYDNPMPPWWTAMFKLTIIFGVFYMVWVHWFGWNHLDAELAKDKEAYAEAQRQNSSREGEAEVDLAERSKDTGFVATGKEIFSANCAPCHGAAGEGVVGPNLTDHFWLHGGQPSDIVKVISAGVPAKGMVAWGAILGPAKINQVAAYILTLRDTNPPNAKAPQGEEVTP